MGKPGHFFRGYHFEDTYEHVLKTEIAILVKESNTLYFEDDFNENEFFDLEYYFTAEKQLKSIKIDVYLASKAEGRKLAYEIKDFLTNQFNKINRVQEYGYQVMVNIHIAPREKDAGFVLIISRPENMKK